jgi:hypothetical protein
MQCCSVLQIVPITLPGSSSSLSVPSSVSSSSSSSSSPSYSSMELARILRQSAKHSTSLQTLFRATLAVVISRIISVSMSWTRFLATPVSISTQFLTHFSFSPLLKLCSSCHFSTTSFFLDRKLCNASLVQTLSDSKPLLPSFAWWHRHVDIFVQLLYLPTGSGEKFFSDHWLLYRMLTMLLGAMLYVARYGPHGGKLSLLRQGSYVWSTVTLQNLRFDHHLSWNCNTNRTLWHDS